MEFKEYAAKEAADLVVKLTRAASTGAPAAVQRVSDEAKARLDAVEATLKSKTDRVAELEAAVAAAVRDRDALKEAHGALESAHVKLGSQHESLRKEAEAGQAAADKLRQDAQNAQTSLERFRQESLAAQEKLRADAHAQLEKLRQELLGNIDAADAAHARAAEQAKTAEAQLRAARAQADAARAEVEAVRAEIDAVRAETSSSDSLLERLLVAFESLATAPGITDLLIALAESLAAEFRRVALFRVKGNKLQGEYQTGFDFGSDVAKVVIPLSMDSLLARAVASGCIETMEADSGDAVHSPFGGSPTCAFALPVAAGGETLGILYADDGATGTEESADERAVKGRYAEVLLRHAVALVLRLTAELRTIAELRGHAARLLNHAEEMYSADVDAGVQGADLQARLLENLECARRLYAQRVAVEGPAAVGLLEDQLVLLLEQRAGTPFGRDLATVSSGVTDRAEAS
jgi:hypothetical protein